MTRIFDKPINRERTVNYSMRALLVVACCLTMISSNALFPNDANAWSRGDKVVVQNQAGLRVREDTRIINSNIKSLLPNGAVGTVMDGPVDGINNSLIWYEVSWETPKKVRGYSAESQNGCVYLITPERAMKKNKLVEKLFNLKEGTADAKTYHDYNGYGCDPNHNNACDGYRGGHSGWDVQTKSVAGDATANEDFYSLTSGEVIRAGSDFGTIAVYNVNHDKTVLYLHARRVYVNIGDRVDIGDRLGVQGDTSTRKIGEHVHIEVRNKKRTSSACGATTSIDPVPELYDLLNIGGGVVEPPVDTIVRIEPESVESPTVGQELEFNLEIEDGVNVFAYQATIEFDKTALRYLKSKSKTGNYLSGRPFFDQKVEGNTVTLISTAYVGQSNGDGTLATLVFEVIAVKESTLKITDVRLSNIKGQGVTPRVEHAEIIEPIKFREDVNGDGTVNIQDLVLVASNFGKTGENDADINNDGVVNIQDLVLVAAKFGSTNAAPTLYSNLQGVFTASDVQRWLSQARQLSLTDTRTQKGIHFLEQLLIALTPKQTLLLSNYPNPFNPETWIPYQLANPSHVRITIYDAHGSVVRQLDLGHQPVGIYQTRSRAAHWEGTNNLGEPVASGLYFYTLTAGDFTATRKMLILK